MIEPGFLGALRRKGLVEDLCFRQRFANANTFLCEAHHHLSVTVNMWILSNKISWIRLFWAVAVMHFLCCDSSEDSVALTIVRSPNKNYLKNSKKNEETEYQIRKHHM